MRGRMWWVVCLVNLVTVGAGAQLYHHNSYDALNLDEYDDEVPSITKPPLDALTRVRRFGGGDLRMLNPQEMYDVKDAIKKLLSGRNVDLASTSSNSAYRSKSIDKRHTEEDLTPTRSPRTRFSFTEEDWFRERAILRDDTSTTTAGDETTTTMAVTPTRSPITKAFEEPTTITTGTTHVESTYQPITTTATADLQPTTTPTTITVTDTPPKTHATESETPSTTESTKSDMTAKTYSTEEDMLTMSLTTEYTVTKISNESTFASTKTSKSHANTTQAGASTVKRSTTTTRSTTTRGATEPETTETPGPKFDIEALLAIVANMTYDYDTNLTQQLNETLQRFSIPTCEIPTTTTTGSTTETTTELSYNTTVVSKCFVCGMDTHGIPRNTFCADAFATDFLPLVPIDPRAKGHISRFRKYCRYLDVNNFQRNRSDPHAMLGRWTGGCAVRWVDLSGVYTQRTCRNRFRPTTGKHYGSKRMAKLELALANVDDGCVTSPMATLVPLSRGISLYARFHACVCTGNWCNRAEVIHQRTAWLWLLFVIMVEVVR